MTTAAAPENATPVHAFIGLGSNLESPEAQLRGALDALAALDALRVLNCSSLYRSPPMGPQDQPDFVNAVAKVATTLAPVALLDGLQAIEAAHGRVRERRWGPRTLDLDLLLYGDERIDSARLTVPHPGLPERAFVLYPLAELAPELDVPGLGRVDALLARVAPNGIRRLTE